jgi:hypothetical protein
MEGGIFVLLIIAVGAVIAFFVLSGGGQALRHRKGGDLGPPDDGDRRPLHRVAEPDDEHAAGFGVSGEHGEPRPARIRD